LIKVQVTVKNGETHISITGHAGYAEHGKDIVCAGVSAVAHSAILGLNAIAEAYPLHVEIEIDQD
jgi:uncharacterized protein YsxB (DUF464 family)